MQNAETVLGVLRERGRRGLPCNELYRQLFNPHLYLLAYGRLYSNQGAMTPGVDGETVDGMSQAKIGRIIDALRRERYRFRPVKRVYIPKKNGKLRPLGRPSWSDKLVSDVIRLLLEAYYEPQFSDRSHGFRPGKGCHTALREVATAWTGTTWFIESDIAQCFDRLDHSVMLGILGKRYTTTDSCGCCVTCYKPDTSRIGSGMPHSAALHKAEWPPRSCPISTWTSWTRSSRQSSYRNTPEENTENLTQPMWR
jgi:Reverse transcriptase (RNA-dependent DNA polymerase)